MALLTPQAIPSGGLAATYAAASVGGDTVPNAEDGRVFLHVKNGGGSAVTVTVGDPGRTPAGNPGTPSGVSVPAAGDRFIPLQVGVVDASDGLVDVTYSGITSVTVAALRR